MKIKTKSPITQALGIESGLDVSRLKEPLKFTSEALDKLTMDLMGYPFISFGNALLCPKCGVQQGVLTNVAPDGEVNFYLNFRCDDYKDMEQAKQAELDQKKTDESTTQPDQETTQSPTPTEQDAPVVEPTSVDEAPQQNPA